MAKAHPVDRLGRSGAPATAEFLAFPARRTDVATRGNELANPAGIGGDAATVGTALGKLAGDHRLAIAPWVDLPARPLLRHRRRRHNRQGQDWQGQKYGWPAHEYHPRFQLNPRPDSPIVSRSLQPAAPMAVRIGRRLCQASNAQPASLSASRRNPGRLPSSPPDRLRWQRRRTAYSAAARCGRTSAM